MAENKDEKEIVVKPLGVDGAPPFVIDEKDLDPKSYEKVRKTKEVAEEINGQTERKTLHEQIEEQEKAKGDGSCVSETK